MSDNSIHQGEANPGYRKRMGYQAGLLGGMALLSTVALVLTDRSTQAEIALRLSEDLQALLGEVLPASAHDNDLLADSISLPPSDSHPDDPELIYRATQQQQPTGVAYRLSEPGYSGDITVLMGISSTGELLGVRVVSHTETPGLGDKIEAGKSDWIQSFTGLSLENPGPEQWAVKKDGGHFDQFSGATITPRAVIKATKRGLQAFERRKQEMLAMSVSPPVALPVKSTQGEPETAKTALPAPVQAPVQAQEQEKAPGAPVAPADVAIETVEVITDSGTGPEPVPGPGAVPAPRPTVAEPGQTDPDTGENPNEANAS